MEIDTTAGPGISLPWIQVSRIDTRPHRICIECDCRNIDCNLVSFNPLGWKDFVRREGFRYYWWSNRISFNMSHEREYRGIEDVLRGYTFDNQEYPFLKKEKSLN
jgi:hypothetical protein